MADVLDQDEVDALLNAVAGGGLEDEAPEEGTTVSLDDATAKEIPIEVHTYDFKRPERVSKDQMLAFEGLHERFARSIDAWHDAWFQPLAPQALERARARYDVARVVAQYAAALEGDEHHAGGTAHA